MCRNVLEGGRRCPCDNSEARRLRRHNSTAISAFQTELSPKVDKTPRQTIVINPDQLTMDRIRSLQSDVNALKEIITGNYDYFERETKFPIVMSDGTIVEAPKSAYYRDELVVIAEKYTTDLGENIRQLVELRTGFRDEDISEEAAKIKTEAETEYDKLKAEEKALRDEQDKKWPKVVDENGKTITYAHTVYAKALLDDADEEALAHAAKVKEINGKMAVARQTIIDAQNGTHPAIASKIEANREEFINIVSSMRSLGGEVKTADNSASAAVKILKDVQKVYPTEWIEASNAREPFRAKNTSARAHYTDGAYQNSYKVITRRRVTFQPEGWEPDPLNNRYENGEWHKIPDGGWKDPETGMLHEATPSAGKEAWVYTPIEWAHTYQAPIDQPKPHGRGWISAQVNERIRDRETGEYTETLATRWYRPVKKRTLVESVRQPELTISGKGDAGYRVGLHEFAHRVESTQKVGAYIKAMEEQFLVRRTTTSDGEREEVQTIYKGTKEKGRPDDFVDKYMGKFYADGYREVLSTGSEAVFANSFGGLIGLGNHKKDPDMKNFIMGLWASA